MSEELGDLDASPEPVKVEPDYFAFYTQEIQTLLSTDVDFLPFSTSKDSEPVEKTCGEEKDSTVSGSFLQGIGGRLPDFKKERLKSLLKQAVVSLSQEVDDMLDPVIAIRQIQSQLRSKKCLKDHSSAAYESDVGERPRKKIRLPSLSSSESDDKGEDADPLENEIVNGAKRCCCQSTGTTIQKTGPKGSKSLCNFCGLESKQEKLPLSGDGQNTGSFRGSNIEANTESKEVDNDLQFLVENDAASVESSVKKYSEELFMMLEHMEHQLEGLLDLLQSSNRLMSLTEKQQLQKLIQKLPPRNLDRVAEIIQKNKQLAKHSSDAIHVNLEEEDNVTLWRLYIYVKAVENAKKLAGALRRPK